MGQDQDSIWRFSFPSFSGPKLNDSGSFTGWFCDFSITSNCSLQALLSISEPTVPKTGRAGLEAAFKGSAQREVSEDSRVQTHKALPPTRGVSAGCPEKRSFPMTTVSPPGTPRGV